MNIKSLFQPVTKINIAPEIGGLKVFDYLYVHEDEFPDLEKAEMVIFSVGSDSEEFYSKIRQELFELYCGYAKQKVVDLGILTAGVNQDDTLRRVKAVCETFYQRGIITIVLGDQHAYTLGQFYGFENLEKDINVVNVDSTIDLKESENLNESHIKNLLLHQPNYIHNFTQLGYQSYLNPPEYQETLEQLSFDHVRLGKVVENIKEMEPFFRMADMVSFDMNVIKSSDIGGNETFPFGISAEQACQLAWYSGLSSYCRSFGVYFSSGCATNLSAKLIAVMIWYFMEGFSERDNNFKFDMESVFRKYLVDIKSFETLTFYKNKIRGQWWVEIPVENTKKVIPCSYNDYLLAVEGEVPAVYLKGIEKHY